MAEKQEPLPQRKLGHSNRARPNQNRIYQHLGVRDLREIIDRKRSEKGHNEAGVPPPDPSYNYLKDPLREDEHHGQNQGNFRRNKAKPGNSFKKDKESSVQAKQKDIENPINIKVEFSTSTGEHVYKFDESTVLPTIKHIPDHRQFQNRSFRSRGRGRGRGGRTYHTRTIRSNNKPDTNHGAAEGGQIDESLQISVATEEHLNENAEAEKHLGEEAQEFEDTEHHEETSNVEEKLENLKIKEEKSAIDEKKDLEKS